jgi:hypothetical protein
MLSANLEAAIFALLCAFCFAALFSGCVKDERTCRYRVEGVTILGPSGQPVDCEAPR